MFGHVRFSENVGARRRLLIIAAPRQGRPLQFSFFGNRQLRVRIYFRLIHAMHDSLFLLAPPFLLRKDVTHPTKRNLDDREAQCDFLVNAQIDILQLYGRLFLLHR